MVKVRCHFELIAQPSLTLYRDNCRCHKCVNQDTMQRSFNILLDVSPEPSKPEMHFSKPGRFSHLSPYPHPLKFESSAKA